MNSLRELLASRPRKAGLIIAVMVVALVAGTYAYLASLPPASGPKVTITSPPLELSVELNKAEYEFAENMTMTFCLKNIGNETITVTWLYRNPIDPSYNILTTEAIGVNTSNIQDYHLVSALFHFGFSVGFNNGTDFFQILRGSLPATYSLVFEPNGYVKQMFVLNRVYGPSLQEGTYQVRGILYRVLIESGQEPLTLETPSIAFTTR